MYKIVFCDLDATLLNDNKDIPEINKTAIKKAMDNGCRFFICSGRSNMSIDHFNKIFGFDNVENYAVAFNGAYIYKTNTQDILVEHLVPSDCALKAIELCREHNVDIMVYRDEFLWFDKPTDKIYKYAERNMVNYKIVDNIENIAQKPVSKVIVIGERNNLEKLEKNVYNTGLNKIMTTFFSADTLYEFNPLNIHKGTGLIELSEILSINIEETIAIGDNYNDLPMIKAAGLGVCCINGEEGVKVHSDYITSKNNNEGAVAEVIEKFVLKN